MLVTVYEIKKSIDKKSKWVYFGHEKAVNGVGEVGQSLDKLGRKYRTHHQYLVNGNEPVKE